MLSFVEDVDHEFERLVELFELFLEVPGKHEQLPLPV